MNSWNTKQSLKPEYIQSRSTIFLPTLTRWFIRNHSQIWCTRTEHQITPDTRIINYRLPEARSRVIKTHTRIPRVGPIDWHVNEDFLQRILDEYVLRIDNITRLLLDSAVISQFWPNHGFKRSLPASTQACLMLESRRSMIYPWTLNIPDLVDSGAICNVRHPK